MGARVNVIPCATWQPRRVSGDQSSDPPIGALPRGVTASAGILRQFGWMAGPGSTRQGPSPGDRPLVWCR